MRLTIKQSITRQRKEQENKLARLSNMAEAHKKNKSLYEPIVRFVQKAQYKVSEIKDVELRYEKN